MGLRTSYDYQTSGEICGRRGQRITQSDEIVGPGENGRQIKRDADPFMAESWTAANDADYICTTDHNLIRVTSELVSSASGPGLCDGVSSDVGMNLIVSFRGMGLFRFTPKNGWVQLSSSPYRSAEGDYPIYLAASIDSLAIAIDAHPVLDPVGATKGRVTFTRDAPTGLWISANGALTPVSLR